MFRVYIESRTVVQAPHARRAQSAMGRWRTGSSKSAVRRAGTPADRPTFKSVLGNHADVRTAGGCAACDTAEGRRAGKGVRLGGGKGPEPPDSRTLQLRGPRRFRRDDGHE